MNQHTKQKQCRRCLVSKPVAAFYKNRQRPDGRASYCADCYAMQQRQQTARKNGLTIDAGLRMWEDQGFACAECNETVFIHRHGAARVDYRKAGMSPRAVLCVSCHASINATKNMEMVK